MTKTMAEVLAEHHIRWVLTADPDYNERTPHVGRHLPECLTCGPVGSDVVASGHQAAALAAAGFGLVADAGAKALEDAAEDFGDTYHGNWLRTRAAAVRDEG